jgi:hypothetical protein
MAARSAWTKFRVQSGDAALLITLAPQTTTGALTPQRLATSLLAVPPADSSTIWARRTNECGRLRERTIERSCARSDGLIIKAAFGLPIPFNLRPETIADGLAVVKLFMGHHTSRMRKKPDGHEYPSAGVEIWGLSGELAVESGWRRRFTD